MDAGGDVGGFAQRELFDGMQRAVADGDRLVGRQLELFRNLMLRHQVPESLRARIIELEASVEARFSRHRGVVRGEEVDDNAIKRILRESDDSSERREAWEASKTVGAAVADDVRELARLRNEAARALGMSRRQILVEVELPLSAPLLADAARTVLLLGIATAAVGALAGAQTLGTPIITGLQTQNDVTVLQGAAATAAMACAADALCLLVMRWWQVQPASDAGTRLAGDALRAT